MARITDKCLFCLPACPACLPICLSSPCLLLTLLTPLIPQPAADCANCQLERELDPNKLMPLLSKLVNSAANSEGRRKKGEGQTTTKSCTNTRRQLEQSQQKKQQQRRELRQEKNKAQSRWQPQSKYQTGWVEQGVDCRRRLGGEGSSSGSWAAKKNNKKWIHIHCQFMKQLWQKGRLVCSQEGGKTLSKHINN